MADSPCLACEHRDRDKNSEECVNCEDRIKYATEKGMIFEERAKSGDAQTIKGKPVMDKKSAGKVKKVCVDCDSTDIRARGRCGKHYMIWRKLNPGKIKKYRKKKAVNQEEKKTVVDRGKFLDIRLQAHAKVDLEKHEILTRVSEIAHSEYRTIQNQAFYFLKGGVEEWQRSNKQEEAK